MIDSPPPARPARLVGLEPWLPWPLSAWRWWTEPVPAERLAALRIGLALFLIVDICSTYWPNLDTFFLDGGPSGARVFGWYTQAPRWTWSVLRGLGDPLISVLILLAWLGAALGIVLEWLTGSHSHVKWRWLWLLAGVALIGGHWLRLWEKPADTPSFWMLPAAFGATALLGVIVELFRWRRGTTTGAISVLAAISLAIFLALFVLGVAIDIQDVEIPALMRLLGPWQQDAALLRTAAVFWLLATVMLLIGWQTRVAAVTTWVLSTSFANLNPNIDNAGDVVRGIILFYLMLCPCGAVWSLDRLWQRRRTEALSNAMRERIVVHPWPLRLLFVQLVFIYFVNGLYKVSGHNWVVGDSLHYVLCDVTLTRFSYAQFPLPLWLTRIATWTVLVWEVGFPLWVSLPWTRKPALWFGVLFHLGIYVTMELGNFVPYVLTLYLPLLPWEKLGDRLAFRARGQAP